MSDTSIAHRHDMNHFGTAKWPDRKVPWDPASPPDLKAAYPESRTRTTGRLRSCGYCGSMHPADVAAAIRAGAKGDWADWKYGWPHKAYFDGIPNPHAGMLESRMSTSHATPICKYSGKACEHGEQSSHRPHQSCTCLAPGFVGDAPTEGVTSGGQRMVRVQIGFNRTTGAPEFGWQHPGEPARATTYEKFYTVHLQDATPEDRALIEQHLGLAFEFSDDGRVAWKPCAVAEPAA
ncbi:MAG: hypothetical protein LCH79_16300 [Proteobacteria bacterium]|nr:hypothetical protein [Pseudomonadota bacterium]